jgi:hypothetical protein
MAFIAQADGPDLTVHTVLRGSQVWTIISHADGWDRIVAPDGVLIDAFDVDTRDDSDEGELLAWFSDNV